MKTKKSMFADAPDIIPEPLHKNMSASALVEFLGKTCFEARNVFRGAHLFERMINDGDTIWLGIAGAGIAGGMGGMVINLIQQGFIDVICSTGAQVYHDLHFAFDLPVKAISPTMNDDVLRLHGDTRIYDIGIREVETLQEQDSLIQKFIQDRYEYLKDRELASWEINYELGVWAAENSKFPERSFVIQAALAKIPIFWDSHTNHSIAMNLLPARMKGFPVRLSADKDILDSAAISYNSPATGFVELGGGGPKNFIQQTGPTISQILGIEFHGADRGLQISTAVDREGSLSSCTFGEAVTWGKYRSDDKDKLIQIWGEYSIIFPLLIAYILDKCEDRKMKNICDHLPDLRKSLENAK